MLSDVLLLLIFAFVVLLVLAAWMEEPLVFIVAGMVCLLIAVQGYNETSEAFVGMTVGALGVVVLLGGLDASIRG